MLPHSQDNAVKAFGKVCASKLAVSNASPIDESIRASVGLGSFPRMCALRRGITLTMVGPGFSIPEWHRSSPDGVRKAYRWDVLMDRPEPGPHCVGRGEEAFHYESDCRRVN